LSDALVLSVIIAASDSMTALERTVASLRAQVTPHRFEILVAAASDRFPGLEPQPGLRVVVAAPGTGVPRLRRLGLAQAAGTIAVFTEDSCVFQPNWINGWLQAFRPPAVAAATGPVEPAMGNATLDWAVFFCEYAPFLQQSSPLPTTSPARLAGNNFAVRIADGYGLDRPEIQESDLHRTLSQSQAPIVEAKTALAWHVRRYAWREAFGNRLRFGLEFGRLRRSRHSRWVNIAAGLAGPAIFLVQALRLALLMAHADRHHRRFLASLPITLGLLMAWSVGESLGWAGVPASRRPVDSAGERTGQTPEPAPAQSR